MTKQQAMLIKKAKKMMSKFADEAQALFDNEHMDDDIASSEVFSALQGAQSYAEEGADQ